MSESSADFDVIIIGGGPGGLSAALWCADLGLAAIVLEKEPEFGGQLLWTFNPIDNYLGIGETTGRELRDRFLRQVEKRSADRLTGVVISAVNLHDKKVSLADGTVLAGKAMILATGIRRRRLEVPGEVEFAGRGVLVSGAKDRDAVIGKNVVIVGGGDAALENALILSETASKVIVVHRRGDFSARSEFVERAKGKSVISFLVETTVTAVVGNTAVEAVEVLTAGKKSMIPADAVLIRIGVVPNSELFRGQVSTDDAGYLLTDAYCGTSACGVYAIGDVANPVAPTISGAVGHGSVAAKAVFDWLARGIAEG